MRLIFVFILLSITIRSVSQVSIVNFTSGLTGLTDLESCGDERIFGSVKAGKIFAYDSLGNQKPGPFLSITGKVNSGGLEKGLLGFTFDKNYDKTGVFYVYYVALPGVDTRISRFRVSSNADYADSTYEQVIITIPQPVGSHFGGDMAFGKDGYLYLGLGDGGGEGDPSNHAQDTSLFLGKFLRINVSDTTQSGYTIPPDNPFLNSPFPDEVWSVGFRNPWRWSFDRMTGDMWIGDVGQGAREEIDMQPFYSQGGENYGWKCYEGSLPYDTTNCAPVMSYVDPVYDYSHSNGCSVTGGFVYRGAKYHTMFGKYFYSDWCSSALRALTKNNNVYTDSIYATGLSSGPVCFTEDRWGDLYMGLYNGEVYRIIDSTAHHVAWISDEDTLNLCSTIAVLETPAGSGFHYQWYFNGATTGTDSNKIAITQAGDYYVSVANAFGLIQISDTVYVNLGQAPSVSMNGVDSTYCLNDPQSSIIVNPIGGHLSIDGIAQPAFVLNPSQLNPGNHVVQYSYTNINGCTGIVQQQVFIDACNFSGSLVVDSKTIYPVPASKEIYIRKKGEVRIFDLNGKEFLIGIKTTDDFSVADISSLPDGIYICRVTSADSASNFLWVKN